MRRSIRLAAAGFAAGMLMGCCPIGEAQVPHFEVTEEIARQYEELEPLVPYLLVTAERAKVRRGPGEKYEVVGHLQQGERYHLFEEEESGWYLVDRLSGYGFVAADSVMICNSHPVPVTAVPFRMQKD